MECDFICYFSYLTSIHQVSVPDNIIVLVLPLHLKQIMDKDDKSVWATVNVSHLQNLLSSVITRFAAASDVTINLTAFEIAKQFIRLFLLSLCYFLMQMLKIDVQLPLCIMAYFDCNGSNGLQMWSPLIGQSSTTNLCATSKHLALLLLLM